MRDTEQGACSLPSVVSFVGNGVVVDGMQAALLSRKRAGARVLIAVAGLWSCGRSLNQKICDFALAFWSFEELRRRQESA